MASVFRHEYPLARIPGLQIVNSFCVTSILVDHQYITKLRCIIVLVIGSMRNIGYQPAAVKLFFDEGNNGSDVFVDFRILLEVAILISNTPPKNGRMVEVLPDKF